MHDEHEHCIHRAEDQRLAVWNAKVAQYDSQSTSGTPACAPLTMWTVRTSHAPSRSIGSVTCPVASVRPMIG